METLLFGSHCIHPKWDDDEHDVEDSESDKAETEYLSTSEGSKEADVNTFTASEGSSRVGVDGNFHSNPTGKDGGEASSKESNSSVSKVSSWVEVLLISFGLKLSSFDLVVINSNSQDDGEKGGKNAEVKIFLLQE